MVFCQCRDEENKGCGDFSSDGGSTMPSPFVLKVVGRRKKGPKASQEDNLTIHMNINVETT